MMRVAVLTDRFPPSWGGGLAASHYHLARLLASKGFDVRVFSTFDPLPSEAQVTRHYPPAGYLKFLRRLNSLLFGLLDKGRTAYQTLDIAQRILGYLSVRKSLRTFAPDIVLLPDHGAPGIWLPKLTKARRIMIAHHNPSRFADLPGLGPFSPHDIRLAMALEDVALRKVDAVLCPSAYMQDVFKETHRFNGPVHVFPNLIDPVFIDEVPERDPRAAMGLSPEAPLVYLPASGNRFKGADFLPALLAGLVATGAPFGVYISGHVPKHLLAALPVQARILTPGPLPGDQVLALVKACSFALYPTLVENYSMAILEALLCGVPVLTFDVGGNRELVMDGINGHLAAPYEIDNLISRAQTLLRDAPGLARLRETTRNDAAMRLSANRHVDRLTELLQA